MQPEALPGRGGTVVAQPAGERTVVRVGFPVVGAVLAWLLKLAAGWVASLPWAPFQGLFKLVASLPEPQATIVAVLVGIAAGVVFVLLAERDYASVRVTDDQVTITRGGSSRNVSRSAIAAAYLDGKQLVLLGQDTRELARQGGDLDLKGVRAALAAHGYPWRDGDPHADDYRRWVEGLPGLPTGADALLRARARALHEDNADDAAQLREELGTMGVVVRDEDKRQYWRLASSPAQ